MQTSDVIILAIGAVLTILLFVWFMSLRTSFSQQNSKTGKNRNASHVAGGTGIAISGSADSSDFGGGGGDGGGGC